MRKTLFAMAVLVITGSMAFWAGVSLTRPRPPDLSDQTEWTLIKAAFLGSPAIDVTVYCFRHLSTDRDPYDVAQNRIDIVEYPSGAHHQYMWPEENAFAGGWCELLAGGGIIAVVLFDGDSGVRVVSFSDGTFRFREGKDELITPLHLRYLDVDGDGQAEFAGYPTPLGDTPKVTQVWEWTAQDGFVDKTNKYGVAR